MAVSSNEATNTHRERLEVVLEKEKLRTCKKRKKVGKRAGEVRGEEVKKVWGGGGEEA